MEKLIVKAGDMELKVKGSMELICSERDAFYQHINKLEDDSGKLEVPRSCGELRGTWTEIDKAIKAGADLKVGDYKSDRTLDGCEFTMVVTDVTDEYVRFDSRDCVGKKVQWNRTCHTEGGYPASDVHNYLNRELWKLLPKELRAVISPCERRTLIDGRIEKFTAKLFLPAASEVFDRDDCYGDNGVYEQMDYYKDRRHRMRGAVDTNDTVLYWLGSARGDSSTNACNVDHGGYANYASATNTGIRVPLCFIIKKS